MRGVWCPDMLKLLKKCGYLVVSLMLGFHVFAVEWERESFRWFVDGVQVQEQKEWSSSGGPFPAPFDQKYFLVLNLAVSGGFGGPVGAETRFPAQFKVDYVRVLQR